MTPEMANASDDNGDDDNFGIPDVPVVRGHSRSVGDFVKFPHRCPGLRCAIARWIREHDK